MKRPHTVFLIFFTGIFASLSAVPYKDLVPKFDRIKSNAMVREIQKPTLSNLDFAAYSNNPVRYDPKKYKPAVEGEKLLSDMTFTGFLSMPVNSIEQTPLTKKEREKPMAWVAMENKLWELTKDQAFLEIKSKIEGEKFGDVTVFKPFQKIAAAWLHTAGDSTELWVKIEFQPWVSFLEGITDEDDDGFMEIYGKVNLETIQPENLSKAITWIKTEYTEKTLTKEEIVDWINILASYWYPTLNTDIVDMTGERFWPTTDTERKVKRKLRGLTVNDPVAVVRGNPFGKPIYNVYVIKGMRSENKKERVAETTTNKSLDTTVSENSIANDKRFSEELQSFDSYETWAEKNDKTVVQLQKILKSLADGQMGFAGKDDWVFFRKSLDYLTGGDITAQQRNKNPLPHIIEFKEYLERQNINLIFMPVPTKAEIYYEKLPGEISPVYRDIVNPFGRKFLKELQDAGVEVIDLLPHFLAAKKDDKNHAESLYQHQDTHWTTRGLQIAAKLVADRIKNYAWFSTVDKVDYRLKDTTFSRLGDIVDKLPETERTKFPPVVLEAKQVRTPDGQRYRAKISEAPLMLIGDSFTGVYEKALMKGAGLGAHIAYDTKIPVFINTSWGGGPLVRERIPKMEKYFGNKRVVIYTMVARDLYDYEPGGWKEWKDIINR